MKLKMLLAGLLMSVLLTVGCATTGGIPANPQIPDYTKEIKMGCAAVAAAEKIITVAANADKLTKVQTDQIKAADAVVLPVCGADKQPTLSSIAYAAFLNAVTTYSTVALKAK